MLTRRDGFRLAALGSLGALVEGRKWAFGSEPGAPPLKITGLTVTPIALPDPPLLNAAGCHGPYFLRNVVELKTDAGIVGIGETVGGEGTTRALEKVRDLIVGQNAFAYRRFARELFAVSAAAYAGIELACLDACGRATGRRLCELLGGPARDPVEFSAYLFYRYAADHPTVLADERIKDGAEVGRRRLTIGARSARPRRWPRPPRGSASSGGSVSSSLKGACSLPSKSLRR